MHINNKYQGNSLQKEQFISGKRIAPYIPSETLKDAVNLMMLLKKRPLLLMGEPGCGKTKLAEAVAYDLYGDNYQDYYFEWNIKSTTNAKDGLYRYDALKRLSDAQVKNINADIDNLKLDAEGSYIKSGEMGKAFKASKKGKPAIILIDEIDKADLDFPNDLLNELDKFEFVIEETGERIPSPTTKPLIFITSNGEKELPPAFLRRCIFHYIKFPDETLLSNILNSHFAETPPEYVQKAITDFMAIRKTLERTISIAEKKVSTSELIDWFTIIDEVTKLESKPNLDVAESKFKKDLDNWMESENQTYLPFYQVLLKNIEARKVMEKTIKGTV